MSISSDARFTPAKAASTTSSGAPTKVTVRRFARIDVQDLHAARPLDRFDDPADHLLVASLAEIGDALHDSLFHIVCSFRILCFKYNEFPEQFR